MKTFAGREQDWGDVKGIIARQVRALDWQLILSELRPLCELKESHEIVKQLEKLRDSNE
jgi:hypothetical protein